MGQKVEMGGDSTETATDKRGAHHHKHSTKLSSGGAAIASAFVWGSGEGDPRGCCLSLPAAGSRLRGQANELCRLLPLSPSTAPAFPPGAQVPGEPGQGLLLSRHRPASPRAWLRPQASTLREREGDPSSFLSHRWAITNLFWKLLSSRRPNGALDAEYWEHK